MINNLNNQTNTDKETLIFIKDKDQNFNPWVITSETEKSYKVEYLYDRRKITQVYKNLCYMQDGKLHTSEDRNVKTDKLDIGITSFGVVRLES